jgi:hypothetical protein
MYISYKEKTKMKKIIVIGLMLACTVVHAASGSATGKLGKDISCTLQAADVTILTCTAGKYACQVVVSANQFDWRVQVVLSAQAGQRLLIEWDNDHNCTLVEIKK